MASPPTRINYTHAFEKQLQKAPLKIKQGFLGRRQLFEENPHHPQLRNHALRGRYDGYRSINITGDWQAIYSEQEYPHGS
jgi:addiction module RelE/StbE family toxin